MNFKIILMSTALLAFLLLGLDAAFVQADSTRQARPLLSAQATSCVSIYSNSSSVHTRFSDAVEIFDDLHTIARGQGSLCGFDLWLRNSSRDTVVTAVVSFYANNSSDLFPLDRIAGPYQIRLSPGADGPVHLDVPSGTVESHMWIGVRFTPTPVFGRGFVGLVDGPANVGSSHDLLYSASTSSFLDFGGLNADVYVTVFAIVETTNEESTWGRVKSSYR